MSRPPLPPGFVLDDEQTPPLPPGFVLDASDQVQSGQQAAAMAGSASMVEQGIISRDEYMRTRGGVGFGGRPVPQDVGTFDGIPPQTRVNDTLTAPGINFGSLNLFGGERTLPASGSLGTKTVKPDILDFFGNPADLRLDRPQSTGPTEQKTMAQSAALGAVDYGRQAGALGDMLIDYSPATALADMVTKRLLGSPDGPRESMQNYRDSNQGVGPVEQGFKNIVDAPSRALNHMSGSAPITQPEQIFGKNAGSLLDSDFERAMTASLEDNPVSTRLGQAGAMMAGGGWKANESAIRALPRISSEVVQKVAPRAAAKYIASNLGSARGLRFGGRVASLGAVSGADYYGINFMSEAPNLARQSGDERASVSDRLDYANRELTNPVGYAGAAASPLYRGGRYAVTTVANTARATRDAAKAAPKPEIMAAGVGNLPPVKYQGGSFTPSDVEARVAYAQTVDQRTGKTLRERVIDDFLDQGFDVDQAETAVRLAAYNGVSDVPEALFEISPALQEMAVAAGRLHGKPAQKMLQQMFTNRKDEFPNALREALRKATAASGDDFEEFVASMKKAGRDASEPGYQKAHATQVSDDTWQNIVRMLGQTPDGVDAAKRGAQLARNSARMRPEYIQAAEELESLRQAINNGQMPNSKLSTLALDFLDRGINRKIKMAMRKGDGDYAGSLLEFRNSFRGSGLDAETGLNVPRTLYAQYKAVGEAAKFGEKAAGKATPLRQMKGQFIAAMKSADEAFEEGIGEGSSIIDTALMQGWIRGAEDFIEMADNPQTAIRQLYGSERQREKLLAMMRELPEGSSSGLKSDNTKRIKALVGSKPGKADYDYDFALSTGDRVSGKVEYPSLFARQKNMLESERLVTGGSPTAGASEALDNQLRQRNSLESMLIMAQNVYQQPARAAARVIDNMRSPPLLRDPEASAEIGRLLTTRGRDRLLEVIAEIRARKLARDSGSNTAPPTGPRPPPKDGPNKRGVHATDVAAIGALGIAPSANAQTQDGSAELQIANSRLETASNRVLQIENKAIPQLEADLQLLQNPTGDAKQIQTLLANRDFDLGPRGVDGNIGPDTRKAIAANIREIREEIAFQRSELDKARDEEAAARQGVTQAEMRAAQAQAAGQGPGAASKYGPWAGAAVGIAAAAGLRYSAVRNSVAKARKAEQGAEALINTRPVNRRSENSPDSVTARAPKVNQFWQQGGAEEAVPFRTLTSGKNRGEFRDRPGAMEPSQLFTSNPPRYTAMDASIVLGGLGEAGGSHLAAMAAKREVAEAKADVERYAESGDVAGMQRALAQQKSAENRLVAFEFARSVGLGLAGGRVVAGMKMNYASVRPDTSRAEQERALLLAAIEKSRK